MIPDAGGKYREKQRTYEARIFRENFTRDELLDFLQWLGRGTYRIDHEGNESVEFTAYHGRATVQPGAVILRCDDGAGPEQLSLSEFVLRFEAVPS